MKSQMLLLKMVLSSQTSLYQDYGNIVPKKTELLRIAAVFNADPKVRAFTEYQEV